MRFLATCASLLLTASAHAQPTAVVVSLTSGGTVTASDGMVVLGQPLIGFSASPAVSLHAGIVPCLVGGDTSCPADFNGDGNTDPDDLADYIGAFFTVPAPTAADFNGDGQVNPDDLADFISAFFGQPC